VEDLLVGLVRSLIIAHVARAVADPEERVALLARVRALAVKLEQRERARVVALLDVLLEARELRALRLGLGFEALGPAAARLPRHDHGLTGAARPRVVGGCLAGLSGRRAVGLAGRDGSARGCPNSSCTRPKL